MKVSVDMIAATEFDVSGWWAKTPEFALTTLRAQLEAAAVIWPELKQYHIVERRKHRPTPPIKRAEEG